MTRREILAAGAATALVQGQTPPPDAKQDAAESPKQKPSKMSPPQPTAPRPYPFPKPAHRQLSNALNVYVIEDHRLPEDRDAAREQTSGYLKRSTIMRLAKAAGFRFVGATEVNANPKDTADWPKGVWTLPPTLILGEQDRDRYLAVGESDRMTLKFVKPR